MSISTYMGNPGRGMTHDALPRTRAMVDSEIRTLAEIVTQSQHLASLARLAGQFGKVLTLHKTASDAAGRAVALARAYPSTDTPKATSSRVAGSQACLWVDELMSEFDQTADGWKLKKPELSPLPPPAGGGGAGLYVLVTRKVSPENRKTGGQN